MPDFKSRQGQDEDSLTLRIPDNGARTQNLWCATSVALTANP
ncbi:MAG: hypothetical protein ABJL67_04900 [Sulfitobacter sp.]